MSLLSIWLQEVLTGRIKSIWNELLRLLPLLLIMLERIMIYDHSITLFYDIISNLAIRNYDSDKPKVCEEYVGIEKNSGDESSKIGEQWNTTVCDVDPSDITSF